MTIDNSNRASLEHFYESERLERQAWGLSEESTASNNPELLGSKERCHPEPGTCGLKTVGRCEEYLSHAIEAEES